MKTQKKILSLVLALAMTASVGVQTLFAAAPAQDTAPVKISYDPDSAITLPSEVVPRNVLAEGEAYDGNLPNDMTFEFVVYFELETEGRKINDSMKAGTWQGHSFQPKYLFQAFDLSLLKTTGEFKRMDYVKLTKAYTFNLTIPKASLPDVTFDVSKIYMMRAHTNRDEGIDVDLLETTSRYLANGDLSISFDSDTFSTFKPVATEGTATPDPKPNLKPVSYEEKAKTVHEYNDRIPSGVVTSAEEGETIKLKLTSGCLIPWYFIELCKEYNIKVEATYFGETHIGIGKNFPTPPEGRVFYDVDEFIKIMKDSRAGK